MIVSTSTVHKYKRYHVAYVSRINNGIGSIANILQSTRSQNNKIGYLKNNLPPTPTYMPVYFASNFHLAFLAWYYDHLLLLSQPGDAREYLFKLYDQLHIRGLGNKQHCLRSDNDYIYELILKIDKHTGHRQFAMSLLWHNVWLLQLQPSSQLQYKLKYRYWDEAHYWDDWQQHCILVGQSYIQEYSKLRYEIYSRL
jgi:hypothetical protein